MKNFIKFSMLIPLVISLGACDTIRSTRPANPPTAQPVSQNAAVQYGSDAWITTKLKSKFAADTKLRSWNIQVSTEQGNVVLNGTVPNCGMKKRAYAIALCRTDNVRSVDVSSLINKDGRSCMMPTCHAVNKHPRVLHNQ